MDELRTRIAEIGRGARRRLPGPGSGLGPGSGPNPGSSPGSSLGSTVVLPLGIPAIDRLLPGGGLALAHVHEVAAHEAAGEGVGFVLALLRRLGGQERSGARAARTPLPVLWCSAHAELYGPGLAGFGFDPGRLIFARARGRTELLWAMEEGLRCPGLAAVVAEIENVGAKAQRRLQLAAEAGGVTGFVLRKFGKIGAKESAFFATNWRIGPAPGDAAAPRDWQVARWQMARWQVELARCRNGATGSWLVEWNHETGDLAVAAPPLDRADRAAGEGESYNRTGNRTGNRAG